MYFSKSKEVYKESVKYIPGGVNSPVRAFKSVGLDPIFIKKAKGAYITDVDDHIYIDYIGSWGPMILGHSNDVAIEGVQEALMNGTSYGLPTPIEKDVAELIVEAYPSVDMVRMVNSGTEATMSALRIARGYTKRDKILKFEGCYHGHSDSLLVKSGSGTLTYGVPTSPGVPEGTTADTLVGRYNDIEHLKEIFSANKGEIAAVIVEPVPGNMGVVPPNLAFLKALREITENEGTVLIFDEVITGFRLAYGGAQEYFNIIPDMTCFGKIIGGGLPVGAYGGKKEILSLVSPLGPVYQAGTLSGNPIAMKMGYNVLNYLKENQTTIYKLLEEKAMLLEEGMNKNIEEVGINATVNRVGNMVCMFFVDGEVNTYEDVMSSDTKMYANYFKEMLIRGVLLPPAQFEGLFLSTEHTEEIINQTLRIQRKVLESISK